MPRKTKEVHTDALSAKEAIPMEEIGDPGPIEPVSENDFVDAAEMEKFMNQELEIIVQKPTDKNSLETITPSVNGMNQPIVRGKRVRVKRKYVEALARCTFTTYEQVTPNPMMPHQKKMIPNTAVLTPFTVIRDPDPNGFEWLQSIIDAA